MELVSECWQKDATNGSSSTSDWLSFSSPNLMFPKSFFILSFLSGAKPMV